MQSVKQQLHRYLQVGREAILWKLEGLSEYDIRRPLVPTGTNLLGLVKHLASVELGYFSDPFRRPHTEELPWWEESAEPNADMWATPEESREESVGLRKDNDNLPAVDETWWADYRQRVEEAARLFDTGA